MIYIKHPVILSQVEDKAPPCCKLLQTLNFLVLYIFYDCLKFLYDHICESQVI